MVRWCLAEAVLRGADPESEGPRTHQRWEALSRQEQVEEVQVAGLQHKT